MTKLMAQRLDENIPVGRLTRHIPITHGRVIPIRVAHASRSRLCRVRRAKLRPEILVGDQMHRTHLRSLQPCKHASALLHAPLQLGKDLLGTGGRLTQARTLIVRGVDKEDARERQAHVELLPVETVHLAHGLLHFGLGGELCVDAGAVEGGAVEAVNDDGGRAVFAAIGTACCCASEEAGVGIGVVGVGVGRWERCVVRRAFAVVVVIVSAMVLDQQAWMKDFRNTVHH